MARTLAALLLLSLAGPACAHPTPKGEYHRDLSVEFTPTAVKVCYTLEIDLLTLVNSVHALGEAIDRSTLRTPDDFAKVYEQRLIAAVPDGLLATIDGKPVAWMVDHASRELIEAGEFHLYLTIPLTPSAEPQAFSMEDTNFPGKKGEYHVVVVPNSAVNLADVSGEGEQETDGPSSPLPFSAKVRRPAVAPEVAAVAPLYRNWLLVCGIALISVGVFMTLRPIRVMWSPLLLGAGVWMCWANWPG